MFFTGQRWFSEAEPELGLGIIELAQNKQVKVFFKAANEFRTYGEKTAPLKRLRFEVGEDLVVEEGDTFKIDEVLENNNIFFYKCNNAIIPEMDLKSALNFSKPQDKLFAGSFDSHDLFSLRYDSFLNKRSYQLFNHKGLLGSKVRLIPHQMYINTVISERIKPKVMLADEVGLGKTIEAGLILKSLIQKHKVHKALIIVPDSLVYQWFFELQNKFQITAKTMSMHDELGIEAEKLDEGSHYIISLKRIMEDETLKRDILERTDWDLMIIDEAHSIEWSKENISPEYLFTFKLAQTIESLILLSATPEILGVEGHFSRLKLLDKDKFSDLESYITETTSYRDHLPIIKKIISNTHTKDDLEKYFSSDEISTFKDHSEIIKALIDTHGTGRVYFRNTREYLEKFDLFFPKRKLHEIPIALEGNINDKLVFSKKVMALQNVLDKYPEQKVLLLVQSKVLALKIQKQLELLSSIPVALFHSGQSLMERDRQAAYFSQDDGARILLCTEIGSEGRNFEFAHHLFLFDLPKLPEQLEQRIGRLDRIGQKKDINIHVPFITGTFEHTLVHWYRDVLKSFSQAPKGATSFYRDNREQLTELLSEKFDEKKLNSFIETKSKEYETLTSALSQGHDALLDLNSFNKTTALKTIESINKFVDDNNIQSFLEKASEACGLHLEELSKGVHYIKPTDNMLIPSYPALDYEGFSYTDSRELALVRDDIQFLSWEHPLILGTIELFTTSEIGNMAIATHEKKLGEEIYIEFIFKLEALSSEASEATRFLPTTPLRVLMNSKNVDVTKKIPKSKLDSVISTDIHADQKAMISKIPKDTFKQFQMSANKIASQRAQKYIKMANESLELLCKTEISRLEKLSLKNNIVNKDDISKWQEFKEECLTSINEATVSIDAIRVII